MLLILCGGRTTEQQDPERIDASDRFARSHAFRHSCKHCDSSIRNAEGRRECEFEIALLSGLLATGLDPFAPATRSLSVPSDQSSYGDTLVAVRTVADRSVDSSSSSRTKYLTFVTTI